MITKRLERRYNIRRKRLNIVREELKERINAVGTKTKRFNSRINQYQQNQLFDNNQGRFFQRLNNRRKSLIQNFKFCGGTDILEGYME